MLPQDLIKLNNLQLAGRLVSEELLLGLHGSKRAGVGVEFEQFRHYQAGDDPKRIDWKRYASTEKHLIRESSAESSLKINLILDLSGSMNYAEEGVVRLDYCKIILASLAYLGFQQNDDLTLSGLQNGELQKLVPAGKQAFQRILYALEKVEAKGNWQNENQVYSTFQTKQKELIILASDLLQVNDEWVNFIQKIANPRREILIFQVLGEQELNFNLNGFYRFKDLETGQEIELEAKSIQAEVKQKSMAYLKNLTEKLTLQNVYLIKTNLKKPIAEAISEGLKRMK
jgi:uncharacterized protein (DUF58 family)